MLFLRTFHVFLLTAAPLTVMKRMKNAEPGRYDLCLLQFVVTLSKQKRAAPCAWQELMQAKRQLGN